MPDTYRWYQQGLSLLRGGDAHAAATVLQRAVDAEPDKGSIREQLGRAYYSSKRYDEAFAQFAECLEMNPASHYAHFGAGLCLGRLGRLPEAVGHLKMAAVMRPDNTDYASALSAHELRRELIERVRVQMAGREGPAGGTREVDPASGVDGEPGTATDA